MVASAETTASEAAPSQPAPADVCRTKVRAAKPHKDKRKRPQHVPTEETEEIEESETPARDLFFRIVGNQMGPDAGAEAG